MELTEKQIGIVKTYVKERIDYADLDFEILDHIISDIEAEMDTNHISFKDAIYKVHAKWKINFNPTSYTLYFGLLHSSPKIVMDKAKKLFKPYYHTFWGFVIFYLSTLFFNNKILNDSSIYFLEVLLKYSLFTFSLLSFSYISIKMRTSKIKTTFSFILKTQLFAIIVLTLATVPFLFIEESSSIISLPLYTTIYSAMVSVTSIIFYKKHIHFVKNKSNYILSN